MSVEIITAQEEVQKNASGYVSNMMIGSDDTDNHIIGCKQAAH